VSCHPQAIYPALLVICHKTDEDNHIQLLAETHPTGTGIQLAVVAGAEIKSKLVYLFLQPRQCFSISKYEIQALSANE
jgi:hypothetical protein